MPTSQAQHGSGKDGGHLGDTFIGRHLVRISRVRPSALSIKEGDARNDLRRCERWVA
jgi:hypothetical protein